jgi:hypothetical protein
MSDAGPQPATGGERSRASSHRRRRLLATGIAVLVLLGVAVVAGLLSRNDPGTPVPLRPSRATGSAAAGAPAAEDLSRLRLRREPFCQLLDPREVQRALGGTVAHAREYVSGQRVPLAPGLRDVSHENGCVYASGAGAQAGVWEFAAPVTRREAVALTRTARLRRGCRPPASSPTFGAPSVSVACPAPRKGRRVALRGLFGDAWVSCELTVPGSVPRPEAVRRAQTWCVGVATAMPRR